MAPLLPNVLAFQRLIEQLGLQAALQIAAMWDQNQDFDALEELYPQVLDPFIAASGNLALQWYQDLSPDVPFEVRPIPLPPREQLAATARFAFTQRDVLRSLTGTAERYVFTTARETVRSNATREQVRYARHASANACQWCRILATNEPRYTSAESAAAGHDNCHCIGVPVREGTEWTPAPYVQGWLDDYNAAREKAGGNIDDITNYLRKENYPNVKDQLNSRRRELYAQKKSAAQQAAQN